MKWNEFFEEIKAGKVRSVYLFSGPEAYIRASALEKLRGALLPAGLEMLNETVLEDTTAQAIIEACETMPVMADRRLVVARDFAPLMPGKARDEEAQAARLIEWLPTAPDTCTLLFYMRDSFDGRKKLSSALIKMGAQVAFELLDDDSLERWLVREARARGGEMAQDAARALVFQGGRDLTKLNSELDKLLAYAGAGSPVTRGMVEALITPSLEATVFQMIDLLMEGRMERVFALVKAMLEAGESRLGILYMLTRQMRLLTHIERKKRAGEIMPRIEKELALKHFAAGRLERQAARMKPESLLAGYRLCVEADYAVKSGREREEEALDCVLLALGRRN